MAGWTPAEWARAYFALQADASGAVAECELDRDRLWLRQQTTR